MRILIFALPLLLLDQVTKFLIEKNVVLGHEITVVDNFFWINHLRNTGMAFGIFDGDKGSNWILGSLAVLALVLLSIYVRNDKVFYRHNFISVVLFFAGISGNLVDRLFRGYVVDFLHFNLGFMHWPSFNVADACITCGAVLMVINSFFEIVRSKSGT